jgi:DNA-binding NarL/FixJ family response regulator
MMLSAPPHVDTVLIVDDTPVELRMLCDALEDDGLRVLVATSGEAAIDVLHYERPDLIVMDAGLPGIDGFATTRAIKADPATAGIPVIFMTGLTDSADVRAALESGAVDYVRKPPVIDELIARVRVHMANARVAEGGQAALDASGRHLIAVDPRGRLKWWTPYARRLLSDCFPCANSMAGNPRADMLPAALDEPVARLLGDDDGPARSLRIALPDSTLELVRVGKLRAEEVLIRLNHINPGAAVARLHASYGLTQREAEVLLWISYGKPNRDISDILGISPRTVKKHLEHLFPKLGVETRSAAAAFAARSLAQ